MLINMAVEGNINVNNLVQTVVKHLAFQEMLNSILMATNQEQLTNIVLIALAEIQQCEENILQSSFYGQLLDY